MKTNMQQAPIRNATTICASVYSHSGEFAPVYTDLQLSGRGLDFKFIRSYRSSLAGYIGDLGRGWSSSIVRKIERKGDDIIYHDGAGEVYKFAREKNGDYTSPTGFYGILLQEKKQFLLRRRYGLTYRFEAPEKGGRILRSEDRNHNSIQFSYSANAIVIIDSLKRKIDLSINKGLVQELKDHAGRTWKYSYDKNDCLIEVTHPETADFPNGTSVRYAYDTNHRLISITDAKGQKYLVNHYDTPGKVVTQEHGSGVFKIEYVAIGKVANGFPVYRTTCIRKNGSKLTLEHNEVGNVLSRTLFVNKESFAPEDIKDQSRNDVPLATKSAYNKNSELTSRFFPAGNRTKWVYSEDEKDPLNQGNLLQLTELPQRGVESDQKRIVTEYEVEPKFQLITKLIDPRGNKTSYEHNENGNLIVTTYPSVTIQPVNGGTPRPAPLDRIQKDEYQYNSMGQLLRRKHIDGSITEYHYYPVNDPIGTRGPNTATNNPDKLCGYLARVVRDANGKKVKTEYAYDNFGNATAVLDGKSNPARLRYNAMGKLERVTSREPFKNRIDYKYDANYNEIESAQSFERLEYDETHQTTMLTSSSLRELREYNALDNVTLRKIVGDDKIITEYFIRDADENIIRQIQPLGNATEYVYDERNLLIEKKFGVGTRETFSDRFTYTLNGAVRTFRDGNGNTTTHHYDGFHRYKGFTNPVGTKKSQWFDEAGNVVCVEIDGDNGLETKKSRVRHPDGASLMEAKYHFDQWNRVYRVDKAWHNHSNGDKLGESHWNGEEGIVSTVLEYAENGLPGKVWTETDNVVGIEYDGVGRVVQMKDLTGEEISFEYDENNNPILMRYLGPEVQGSRFERVLRRDHDGMDRLVWQQENDEAPERFAYNALGNVINYVGKSGIEIHHTDDSLGRRAGHAFTITDALDNTTVQKLARRFEYDDNYRLSAYTDAAGKRTMYHYDTLDRQIGVVFPDGNAAHVEYDAVGNIVRVVDQNNNEINHRYDASNRLVERQSHVEEPDKTTVEQYEYDGLSRLVAAIRPDSVIRRTYDSLSRLLTEQQGEHVLQCTHDSAGNLTNLVYPGGEEVHKAYDIRNRVTSVKNKSGETLASFIYRANDQIAEMLLGNVIETSFSYNQQERLESIEYRRTDNHNLVEGFRYQYDSTGKMTHEIQLSEGPTYGERYYYDDANRATKAQYGVQDVLDPNSSFEQETSYEHFPEGSYKRRVDVDGQGQMIDDQIGTINQLNNYRGFGNLAFAYDANGNCVRKAKANLGYWVYTYDQDNKLIKSEYYDAQGNITQTIEYFYDSLGRQVRKVVTDENGSVTETTYIWIWGLLVEERVNGNLTRTYFYGSGSIPIQLSTIEGDYFFTHNGRGLASGLLYTRDPNAFAEMYGYELTGASYMKEINGVKVGIPSRNSTNSRVLNSILSGNYLRDWQNSTHSGLGGIHINSEIDAVLNAGRGHHYGAGGNGISDVRKQLSDMLGLSSHGKGPTGAGKKGGLPPGVQLGFGYKNWSLYGGKDADNASKAANKAWAESEKASKEALRKAIAADDLARATMLAAQEAAVAAARALAAAEAADAAKKAADEADKAKRAADEAKKKNNKNGGMPNPDADTGATELLLAQEIVLKFCQIANPLAQEVELKFMQIAHPMNPDSGLGWQGVFPSEGPNLSKWDLISLYDGESGIGGGTIFVGGGGTSGTISTIIRNNGYTDYVRGWRPPTLEFDPNRGGTSPDTGQPLP